MRKVDRETFERIRRWRNVYFATPEGKRCLLDLLAETGVFKDPDVLSDQIAKHPEKVHELLFGLRVLVQLGIWTYDNFAILIEKMAQMPMPDLEETT